jgi:hypothetical protein
MLDNLSILEIEQLESEFYEYAEESGLTMDLDFEDIFDEEFEKYIQERRHQVDYL